MKNKTITLLITCICAAQAQAASLVTYVPTGTGAQGNPVNGTSVDPLITAGAIANIQVGGTGAQLSSGASGPVRTANGSWTFGTDGWLFANASLDASNGTAVSTENYFGITLGVANSGDTLNLTNLTFDYGVGQNADVAAITGNFYYGVFASVDGGAFTQIGTTFDSGSITLTQNATTALGNQNIDLSSISGAESVELRVWVGTTSASPSAGSIFQNITINGDVIPEPSVALLGGLGALALLRRRRAV